MNESHAHLIDNVLDFASIEADKKTYDLFPTDLGQVAADTLRTDQFHFDEKGFRLTTEIEPEFPNCLADGDAVPQTLINLLNNAVKYSDHTLESTEGLSLELTTPDAAQVLRDLLQSLQTRDGK